ncbi:MAG TPA: ATP-binding cassette domain-containing protein [Bacteroidetes bacterium]|nr:ATP-binding cassette domain-containing protein [Bacteroidota bacterium]
MVEAVNIYKSFDDLEVLKGINAVFLPGKINCIIGKSGSGKTVFLKTIVGLEIPNKGDILYDNRQFTGTKTKFKKEIRQEIGMVFQGGALFDSLTLIENVIFPLNMFTDLPYEKKLEKAKYSLKRVGLENVDDRYPSELSGGMQKRASIARAIVNNPKYLFCDEPNSGLDPITAGTIDELIRDIVDEYKMTTIVNTHDMNSVFDIADNVIFIHKGQKKWEGSAKDIIHSEIPELREFIDPFLRFYKK